jgi:hypothetical protein
MIFWNIVDTKKAAINAMEIMNAGDDYTSLN